MVIGELGQMVDTINVKGTAHKIGGNQADGQWFRKQTTVFTSQTWTTTGVRTFNVSDYLPDNEYVYEVVVSSYSTTAATAGSWDTWWVRNQDAQFDQYMSRSITRTASNVLCGESAIIPVQQVNGVLTLNINVTNTGTASAGLYLMGYRRLGGVKAKTYYTLTINPTPSDATVTFNKGAVSGNTCTVTEGTVVTYTVSKSGYTTQSGTVTVNADQTVNVTLQEQSYSLPLYGYKNGTDWICYLIGLNSASGYNCIIAGEITAKSGTIGASGSTVTLSGNQYTYSSANNVTISGMTLYCYANTSSSNIRPWYIYCFANAGVGTKVICNIPGFPVPDYQTLQHPYQWTSSYIRVGNSYGYTQYSRASSLDTTFTGS